MPCSNLMRYKLVNDPLLYGRGFLFVNQLDRRRSLCGIALISMPVSFNRTKNIVQFDKIEKNSKKCLTR